MAYDYFENTPFDLNHDGHIDSNEAAYIYENFFSEDSSNTSECDDLFEDDYTYNSSVKTVQKDSSEKFDITKYKEEVRKEKSRHNTIALVIVIVLALLFPDSPGIAIFVGGILLSLKISGVF